jgi:hypothetical protein
MIIGRTAATFELRTSMLSIDWLGSTAASISTTETQEMLGRPRDVVPW